MTVEVAGLEALRVICDRLSERRATLFLGSGINANIRNGEGESFPMGNGLARWIARDLLGSPESNLSLKQAAEMAQWRLDPAEVNRYIFDQFATFAPGRAHLALVQLPWDVVYTTNYDLLIEQAAAIVGESAAGSFRAISSLKTDIDQFSEDDILYYKLHGSIDYANTPEGRLILTRADFEDYERLRQPLFKRLERDLPQRTFVFIGYSLSDENFLDILEGCRQELGTTSLPLSYAVRPHFDEAEAIYWKDRYNIQLVRGDSESFIAELKETWVSENRSVVPFEQRRGREYTEVDSSTRFPRFAESYYQVLPQECTGASNAKRFFLGGAPTWPDIRDKVPPQRDQYWSLFGAMFNELTTADTPPSVYLATGAAGTGKTTVVRSLAYDLAEQFGFPVLVHIPSTPLEARHIQTLLDTREDKRIVIVVEHAADYIRQIERFLEEAKQKKIPVTLILEERQNQWSSAAGFLRPRFSPVVVEHSSLNKDEIDRVLSALDHHGSLGKLTGTSRIYQINHFEKLAHHDLLVALRELTSETSFDDIIRDEYKKVPSEVAKRAYALTSALGQFDLAIRYETLSHLLQVNWADLQQEVFAPTEGVLISAEATGRSRHNAGYRVNVRHPVIGSIIFDLVAPDDDAKLEIFQAILSRVDPGQLEDRRLLEAIARRRQIVETISSAEKRRAIYDLLERILPDDAFVLQHRSSLERDLGDPDAAVSYARRALRLLPDNNALQNTLGLALEQLARATPDPLKRQALLREADLLFDKGLKRDPSDPYSYLGKYYVAQQNIRNESDNHRRELARMAALSLLEEAYEATDHDSIIAGKLAAEKQQVGTTDAAVAILEEAIDEDPADTRLRDLLVRYKVEQGESQAALKIAMDGTKYDPTSWRLQRHIARLQREAGASVDTVKGHYEASLRHQKGDLNLSVELGAYLFQNRRYGEAASVFTEAKQTPLGSQEKGRIRQWWKDDNGTDRLFEGEVKSIGGASAWALAVPENFEAHFFRDHSRLSDLRVNDRIRFTVGFNTHGAVARIQDFTPRRR